MTFQKHLVIGFFIAGLSLPVVKLALGQDAEHTPDLSSLSDADLKTIAIQLERSPCYGNCPEYSVTIHGDGRVEYNGKTHVTEKGAREGRIETAKVRALASEFEKIKFWSLDAEYVQAKCKGYCTDMATAVTELRINGLTHRVKHYYGCGGVPKSLFDLESSVDRYANSEQWTGNVSKAGPMATTCWRDPSPTQKPEG